MKNKRICKTLSALCLTMVVAFGFTIPAFAQGSEQAPAAPALRVEAAEGITELLDNPHCIFRRGDRKSVV